MALSSFGRRETARIFLLTLPIALAAPNLAFAQETANQVDPQTSDALTLAVIAVMMCLMMALFYVPFKRLILWRKKIDRPVLVERIRRENITVKAGEEDLRKAYRNTGICWVAFGGLKLVALVLLQASVVSPDRLPPLSPARAGIEGSVALGLIVCGIVVLAKGRSRLMPGIVLAAINVFLAFAANTVLARTTLRVEDGSMALAAIAATFAALPLIAAIVTLQKASFVNLIRDVLAAGPHSGETSPKSAGGSSEAEMKSDQTQVSFRCSRCRKPLKSAISNRGRQITCPGCWKAMIVP